MKIQAVLALGIFLCSNLSAAQYLSVAFGKGKVSYRTGATAREAETNAILACNSADCEVAGTTDRACIAGYLESCGFSFKLAAGDSINEAQQAAKKDCWDLTRYLSHWQHTCTPAGYGCLDGTHLDIK